MDNLTVASILNQQIQIGKTNIPFVLVPGMIGLFAIFIGMNAIYLKQYDKLISYFKKFHPEMYEQIRMKPDSGLFYSSGSNHRVKPLLNFAKHHEGLNDPKAEKMLADFIAFDRQFTRFASAILIIAVLTCFVIGIMVALR
jgi:hypothetical protein